MKQAKILLSLLPLLWCEDALAAPAACSGPGYHQFDFWLGKWDVFDVGGTDRQAKAVITSAQDGCALREQYEGVDGGGGEGLTMYDPHTDLWRQSWVSRKGQIVLIEGRKDGDAVTLSGTEYGAVEGRLIRGTWTPVKDGVRETAERSSDGGKTWTPWFDIIFRPQG